MLLLLIPQGTAATGLDVRNALLDAVYRLGLQDLTDLVASGCWVTVAELYQWADEAAKQLSYKAGVFVVNDSSITVVAGTAAYSLPATHVFTVAAWLGTTPLRVTPVRELWALDATWPASTGPASRVSIDAGCVGTITVYPKPTAGGTLSQVCQEFPSAIVEGSTTVALPRVLEDYFTYAMLAGARGKESDAAMPEMAKHFRERMGLYEQVMEHLWGPGQ
jgi:hypothetical protein